MIFIAAKAISPRLEYIARIIFNTLLDTDHQVITFDDIKESLRKYPAASLIYYSTENTYGSGSFVIPDEGMLFETTIEKKRPDLIAEPYLKLLFSKKDYSGLAFDFDILSAAFYLITEYEQYADPKYDHDGRYDERQYPLFKEHYHKLPVLHIYAEAIWEQLKDINPLLTRRLRWFDFTISIDVDAPYLYRGRSFALQAGGFVKELLTAKFMRLAERMRYYFSGKDPYDVYDLLFGTVKKEKLLFFFLIDRKHSKDGRYTYKSRIYQQLIRQIKTRGARTGIHPSYNAYTDPSRIIFEKEKLESILDMNIDISRMHFLKYRLPDTYRYLDMAGIKHDYTSCPVYLPGFKNFIAVPFKWFDLQSNKTTELTLNPAMVMDSTLQKYMGLNKEVVLEQIKHYIDVTDTYNGHFVLLFHNSTISEISDWSGWRKIFKEVANYLHGFR